MRPALSLPWSFWSRRLRCPRAASSRFLHRCFELSPRTGRLPAEVRFDMQLRRLGWDQEPLVSQSAGRGVQVPPPAPVLRRHLTPR
jgi:hypothetical protein